MTYSIPQKVIQWANKLIW